MALPTPVRFTATVSVPVALPTPQVPLTVTVSLISPRPPPLLDGPIDLPAVTTTLSCFDPPAGIVPRSHLTELPLFLPPSFTSPMVNDTPRPVMSSTALTLVRSQSYGLLMSIVVVKVPPGLTVAGLGVLVTGIGHPMPPEGTLALVSMWPTRTSAT